MPITLEKLFSPTATVSLTYLDETVTVTFAPFRYTGEMQALARNLDAARIADIEAIKERQAEADAARAAGDEDRARALEAETNGQAMQLNLRDKEGLREVLAKLLVSWDVLDGKKPIPTDLETMQRLPDDFLLAVFTALGQENEPDPQNAPSSDEPSNTERTSAPSPTGTPTSGAPARSGSRRSSSTNGQTAVGTIQPGVPGA